MDDAGASDAPDLRDYGRTLWRHRFLIVATVAIAVGAALAFSFTQTRVYRATADLLIQPNAIQQLLNPTNQNAQNPQFDARNVDTEVAVLQSKIVQDAAKHQLGHTPDVSISSNSATSDVVSVNAQSTNARVAAADANGYADVYVALRQQQTKGDLLQAAAQVQAKISQIDVGLPSLPVGSPAFTTTENQRATLQQELNQLQVAANLNQVGGAQLLARADVPTSPVASQILRDTAIALVLGLLVGVGLAFLRDYVDDKIRSREDLERAAPSLPLLGQLPRQPEWRHRNVSYLVSADAPTSPGAEAYRKLRTSIQFLAVDEEFRSIQITSSEPGEGKTTILANLAVAFARAGQRVTILCCDLRRPRIYEFFGLPNDVGFTSLLLGEASLFEARQAVPLLPNLAVLSAGPQAPNPAELLSTGSASEMLISIERGSDLVLVDCSPVLPVSDALIVSRMVDATVLVASENSSSRRAVHRSIELLRQVDAPLVGTVLNNSKTSETYGYGYEYFEFVSSPPNGSRTSRRQRRKATRAGT